MLSVALILLTGALVACLLGRELLLRMLGYNAVDLSHGAFEAARVITYSCFVAAAVLIGFFAAEVQE